ncbi:MAG TPA: hypothetical protein VKU02_21940 [Gemmataceae bacterium]|nr:hypothetical protein [Gemmataceae bacterium]
MSRTPLISLLAVCFIAPAASHAWAQEKIDKQIAALEAAKAQFLKDKQAEKQKVLKKFDAWIQKVATSRAMKAADRLSLTDDLREERKVFAEKEDVAESSSNDVLSVMLEYGKAVAKKYKPVSSMFDQMMTACINAGKTEEAKKIKADMELFEIENLPGRKHVAAGVIWIGSQHEGNGAIQFLFRVTELHGSLFKARMERNISVGGHPIFNLDCQLDGILIKVTNITPMQGSIPLKECRGILLGQTLLLQLTTLQETTVPRSKQRITTRNISFAVLRMQKK